MVVIDKDTYIEMALINDAEAYCECREQTLSIHSRVLKQHLELKTSIGAKFKVQYIKLHPPGDNSPSARFYGLPKIHKGNPPLSHLQYQHIAHPFTN